MLRIVVIAVLALTASAFNVAAPGAVGRIAASRTAEPVMAAKKKAAPKKAGKKGSTSTEGKGGILPWVTNAPGTYAKPLMLSSVNFLGDDGDSWIGWGFMPNSVKKLYNPNGKKGLL